MIALAASDLHGNHAVYHWLVRTAGEGNADLIILAGDLLGCPDGFETVEEAQRQDAAAIVRILAGTDTPIYYIMGNDDLVELEPRSDQFTSLHGCRVEVGGLNLVGYQYSLPFMGGVYEKSEEEIRQDLAHLENLVDARTILVTHSPAYGILDLGVLDLHAGSQAILDLVRARDPLAHIHGHIHREFGRCGRHFNVAAGGRPRALWINLPTLATRIVGDTA